MIVTVQDVDQRVAARDQMHLVPVADLHVSLQLVGIASRLSQSASGRSVCVTTSPRQATMPRPGESSRRAAR